mgnify:CR=1 FL=1
MNMWCFTKDVNKYEQIWVGQFPSGSAYGAEGCQLVYISFVSLRQAEASSRRVLHDTMGQMDAMV